MARSKITKLDFTEHDTIAALQYLISLCESNRVAGMIFALALKHDRQHPHLCGATGRLADNQVEAAGIASMLNLKLTQEALEASMRIKYGWTPSSCRPHLRISTSLARRLKPLSELLSDALDWLIRLFWCRGLRRHSWRFLHHSAECGEMFECRRCGRQWSPDCGVIRR